MFINNLVFVSIIFVLILAILLVLCFGAIIMVLMFLLKYKQSTEEKDNNQNIESEEDSDSEINLPSYEDDEHVIKDDEELKILIKQLITIASKNYWNPKEFEETITSTSYPINYSGLYSSNQILNTNPMSQAEKERISIHESSHCVISDCLGYPLEKVTLKRTGHMLGHTSLDDANKFIWNEKEMYNKVTIFLAGAAGENNFYKCISSTASDDFKKATTTAYIIIVDYGMGKKRKLSPNIVNCSEKLKEEIEEEANEIVNEKWEMANDLVKKNKKKIEKLAQLLLEKEEILKEELYTFLRSMPNYL